MRVKRKIIAAIVLIISGLLLGLSLSTMFFSQDSSHQKSKARPHTLLASDGIYHGAFASFGATEDIVTAEHITNFEQLVGKKIVWAYFSNNWFNGIQFPTESVQILRENNVLPFIRLMPRSRFQQGGQDPVYTLQKIIDGEFDTELRIWAKDAKNSGGPLLIEFGTEMNGNWFTWSGASNGADSTDQYGDVKKADGPERFRDAYRHIITLFREEGADNITWFFHPNLTGYPQVSWNTAAAYYPGDEYIDWIGISVYGAQVASDQRPLFSTQMAKYYNHITEISSDKPIAVLEFGTIEQEGKDKAVWMDDALRTVASQKYPNLKALSYWHSSWQNQDDSISDMKIDSSEKSLQTYQNIITQPMFDFSPVFAPSTLE